jgi:hypothetical protein
MAVMTAEAKPSGDLKDWTVADLKALKQQQLLDLYKTLPCPTMEEMNGEFKGDLLDLRGLLRPIKRLLAYFALKAPYVSGAWQGKGFAMTSDTEGNGYNHYKQFGKDKYIFPMKTKITKSVFDGKDNFELDYTAYTAYKSQASLINMIDEVRKVNDDLYLGIGTWGWIRRFRMIPWFFSLSGPRAPYSGIKPYKERNRKFSRYA